MASDMKEHMRDRNLRKLQRHNEMIATMFTHERVRQTIIQRAELQQFSNRMYRNKTPSFEDIMSFDINHNEENNESTMFILFYSKRLKHWWSLMTTMAPSRKQSQVTNGSQRVNSFHEQIIKREQRLRILYLLTHRSQLALSDYLYREKDQTVCLRTKIEKTIYLYNIINFKDN
ncbi:hypothetical protein WN51_07393 [Melipona quadrifasciata]|uniref:Uncharacterized protein n=1 Tax=Melipona quadrifasciata TaxID=166423 RepID=A0A0M8ZP75_9HYME|nr:hypothetical protein WN51_07393 [Melipona quadrifasciata]